MECRLTLSTKKVRRFLCVILSVIMLFSLSACGIQKTSSGDQAKVVKVEREPGALAEQTANEAGALALRQYINARLVTETFAATDFRSLSVEEIKKMTNEVTLAWETAELCAFIAEDITSQALLVVQTSSGKNTSLSSQQQTRPIPLASPSADYSQVAAVSTQKIDPLAWAESLTKQYDAIKGLQRYKQLAKQLGTDAQGAYQQMVIAQEIVYKQGMANAEFWDKMTKVARATKATCKVGLLVTSSIATGGSVTLLEGAGFIASGLDCAVEVADTSSTIILGEGNHIAAAFGDIKDRISPVSSIIGLLSFDPNSLMATTKGTADALVYISDSFQDWFYEGKIMGVKVSKTGSGSVSVTGKMINMGGLNKTGAEAALKEVGLVVPNVPKSLSELMESYRLDPELVLARMDALVSQMAEIVLIKKKPENSKPSTGVAMASGLYSASGTVTVWGSTDPIKDFQANVVQNGSSMTISFSNDAKTVLTGTYNSSNGVFIGRDMRTSESAYASVWWQWGDTTIQFNTTGATGRLAVPPTENGLIDSEIIVEFTMTKIR